MKYILSILCTILIERYVGERFRGLFQGFGRFQTAIELESDNPEWYGNRGDCYVEMEDYTSALKDYDKAIDLAPNDPANIITELIFIMVIWKNMN